MSAAAAAASPNTNQRQPPAPAPPPRTAPPEHPTAMAARLASRFDIKGPVEALDFSEKGNINRHTYVIESGAGAARRVYLLQQINQQVFTRPKSVMAAMIAAIDAQRERAREFDDDWEAIVLIPTRSGAPYLEVIDRRGVDYWRLMVMIENTRTFKSLSEIAEREEQLRVASEAGRGLALFGALTSSVDASLLETPLPGYRDGRNYFNQLASVLEGCRTLEEAAKWLPADEIVRHSTGEHFLIHLSPEGYARRMSDPILAPFIDMARREREFGLTFARELESGAIRTVAIHGDTKLDNFLFSASTGRARAMVDLDTVMPHTWLADWGDMARSLVNVAGEKETDLARVTVDVDIYQALAEGFLAQASEVTERELELMVDAVEVIALELGVRFLADYLRGDSYFSLGPADPNDLNKTRAMVQLTLFERLRENRDHLRGIVSQAREAKARKSRPRAGGSS